MIIQSLAQYYEQISKDSPGKIPRFGWCSRNISFYLEISHEGELINIIPDVNERGSARIVPNQVKRSSGINANILCDNASYFLGIDSKGNFERSKQCFDAAKKKHADFLKGVDSPAARAILKYFETWNPDQALSNGVVKSAGELLLSGRNLSFSVDGKDVLSDKKIIEVWDKKCQSVPKEARVMTCLVTGEYEPIARLHPLIKGVAGAQSGGASLIGFNSRAFESYGHDDDQGLNAPVGERSVFAYSTALNYLLSEPSHHIRLGDTTIVYWAEKDDAKCVEAMSSMLGSFPNNNEGDEKRKVEVSDKLIQSIMEKISKGHSVDNIELDTGFYLLGLAPNAARLSVRFFLNSTFGEILSNLKKHYERLEIVKAPYERMYLSPYQLVRELEIPESRKKKGTSNSDQNKRLSHLWSSVLCSVLMDRPYPEALYEQAILRIRSSKDNEDRFTKKVTRGRAAIIKAFLIKNGKSNQKKEVVTVELNEERSDIPYILGRLFSVLEEIQDKANADSDSGKKKSINTTIKDRFFNSACTTPNIAFPSLLLLSEKHMSKIKKENPEAYGYLDKKKSELLARLSSEGMKYFPKRLSINEQGSFILGYYQQHQKRFEKRNNKNETREG